MPTTKDRAFITFESNEKDLLKQLAEEEGVSMSRMMGLLIRREWKRRERGNRKRESSKQEQARIKKLKQLPTSPPQT